MILSQLAPTPLRKMSKCKFVSGCSSPPPKKNNNNAEAWKKQANKKQQTGEKLNFVNCCGWPCLPPLLGTF